MRNWTVIGAALLLGMAPVHAASVLDVNNYKEGNAASGYLAGQYLPSFPISANFQTFTVGKTGTFSSIDLFGYVTGPGNTYVSLYSGGSQTSVGTTLLGAVTRTAASMPGYEQKRSFDFSSFNIAVTAGQMLTFGISADPCGPSGCTTFNTITSLQGGQNTSGYSGGVHISKSGSTFTVRADDLNFRTFVSPAAVPELGSWALFIAGFGMAGAALRIRKQTAATISC